MSGSSFSAQAAFSIRSMMLLVRTPEACKSTPFWCIRLNNFCPSASTYVTSLKSTFTHLPPQSIVAACQLRSSSGTQGPVSLPSSLNVVVPSALSTVILSTADSLQFRTFGRLLKNDSKHYHSDPGRSDEQESRSVNQ